MRIYALFEAGGQKNDCSVLKFYLAVFDRNVPHPIHIISQVVLCQIVFVVFSSTNVQYGKIFCY